MQILLLLLIKENIYDDEDLKIQLRECILIQLKLNHQEVLRYIVEESEISVILIAKLSFFFQALPLEVELLQNAEIT